MTPRPIADDADMRSIARKIYYRMPRLRRFMQIDDVEQECHLRRLQGRGRVFHELHCHVIDIARHLGGRGGKYLWRSLPPNLTANPQPEIERSILINEMLPKLTAQQRRVVLGHLEGKSSQEIAKGFGLKLKTVDQYHSAAIQRMRALT